MILFRLLVLLVSVVVMGYALAASQSVKPPSDPSSASKPAAEESKTQQPPPSQPFVPSEKVSADRAVSFPTDI